MDLGEIIDLLKSAWRTKTNLHRQTPLKPPEEASIMPTSQQASEIDACKALERAAAKWAEAECPDQFAARIDTAAGTPAYVFIYHHETFSLGGQLFTGDVRIDENSNLEMVLRRRISLNGGDFTVL